METLAAPFDFERFFLSNYARIAHAVARITGDHARAEDLASEAFWKLWSTPKVHNADAGAWVYTTAVRLALNEIRGAARRRRYEAAADPIASTPTPEQEHAAAEERAQVRCVLAALPERDAELLLLRGAGFSYAATAAAMKLNPASVGTLLSRAQQAFRKEYLKHYGKPRSQHGTLGR